MNYGLSANKLGESQNLQFKELIHTQHLHGATSTWRNIYMAQHDYSPQQALEILLDRLESDIHSNAIAVRIRESLEEGMEESQPFEGSRSKKKTRMYRQKRPFTDEEALHISLEVLQAHFLELPLFVNSANHSLRETAAKNDSKTKNARKMDSIEIELITETTLRTILDEENQTIHLNPFSQEDIREQKRNFDELKELFTFDNQ